jgi:ABC-type Mn2+/Zn2+ transport system ATPase subunit
MSNRERKKRSRLKHLPHFHQFGNEELRLSIGCFVIYPCSDNATFQLRLLPKAQYHLFVIRRFYIHNFRCLENFELPISDHSSILLIGKNGTGKTSVSLALEILQKIARGMNRIGELVKWQDFAHGRTDVPMRFEIEVELDTRIYEYVIAFELPERFKEMRVLEENFAVDGKPVFNREQAEMHLPNATWAGDAMFRIDWHLAALPIVQERSIKDALFIFKQWLARMLILRPIPSLILGHSSKETLEPNSQVTNFGEWFSGLLASAPAAYTEIDTYLKQVMPDLKDIKNPVIGADARSLEVQYSYNQASLKLPFEDLSDGEKCFMICALVLAANNSYGPLLCFWDEPDSYLALDEVGHFVLALRKAFQSGGQLIATSHNPEAIRRFSEENTFLLQRRNHLEPTLIRSVQALQYSGDLVNALIRGDIEI